MWCSDSRSKDEVIEQLQEHIDERNKFIQFCEKEIIDMGKMLKR